MPTPDSNWNEHTEAPATQSSCVNWRDPEQYFPSVRNGATEKTAYRPHRWQGPSQPGYVPTRKASLPVNQHLCRLKVNKHSWPGQRARKSLPSRTGLGKTWSFLETEEFKVRLKLGGEQTARSPAQRGAALKPDVNAKLGWQARWRHSKGRIRWVRP